MTDEKTKQATRYIVLAQDPRDEKQWRQVAEIETAGGERKAKAQAIESSEDLREAFYKGECPTLVALPARSWKPDAPRPKMGWA